MLRLGREIIVRDWSVDIGLLAASTDQFETMWLYVQRYNVYTSSHQCTPGIKYTFFT